MNARPFVLAETNWKTVQETDYQVAILPWGATEAHNYHLPYATDNIQCDFIATESARKAWDAGAKVVVLPTVPFGVNTGQLDIKLDINMYPSTQAAVLNDVVDALQRQGIPKLVIMNGHGGNDFKQMLRELQARYPGIFLATVHWYKILDLNAYFDEPGDHAGEMETSNIMHITPELVRPLEEAGDGRSYPFALQAMKEGWVWAQRHWLSATADTGVGNPVRSTPEKGARYLEDLSTRISTFLVELAALDMDHLYERED